MQQELWFPQPIWLEVYDSDFSNAIAFCNRLRDESKGRKISNRGGWQSDDIDLFAHEELSEVTKLIDLNLRFLADQLNKEVFSCLRFGNAWVNINKKHSYNVKHVHPGSAFSGCIYLKVPEDSGDLIFYRPDAYKFFPVPRDIYNPSLFGDVTYKPKDGLIIIFPSWLEHEVTASNADEDRISIAFNIFIDGV